MISLCSLDAINDSLKTNEAIFVVSIDCLFNSLYHKGDLQFVRHLLASNNIDDITDGVLWLFRPKDHKYAENWVMQSTHVPKENKPRLQHAIRRMTKSDALWFSVKLSEREKVDCNNKV